MTPALVAALLAASPANQQWNFQTGPKAEVEVGNVAGSIEVRGTTGTEVKVHAVATGKWKIEAKAEGAQVRVDARCPDRSCNEGEVKLVIDVPENSELEITAVSAQVKVTDVRGEIEVEAVSGPIQVSGSSSKLEIEAVSSKVEVAPRVLQRTEIQTVSGDIKLSLPADADAKLSFSSVSGEIDGDDAPRGVRTFGKGAHAIEVQTVSGDLQLASR